MAASRAPWASGPGEILRHALGLLAKDTDANRRIAFLNIDNAVELIIKTYLTLPQRVSGLRLSRAEYSQISESFPLLLDALEHHAGAKLVGIDLGEIEWYHRLRNQLYHQGNGLTVEREKVEVYGELAKLLFGNLFGMALEIGVSVRVDALGKFMALWLNLEREATYLATLRAQPSSPYVWRSWQSALEAYVDEGRLQRSDLDEIDKLRILRNKVVHGKLDPEALDPKTLEALIRLANQLQKLSREHKTGDAATWCAFGTFQPELECVAGVRLWRYCLARAKPLPEFDLAPKAKASF